MEILEFNYSKPYKVMTQEDVDRRVKELEIKLGISYDFTQYKIKDRVFNFG